MESCTSKHHPASAQGEAGADPHEERIPYAGFLMQLLEILHADAAQAVEEGGFLYAAAGGVGAAAGDGVGVFGGAGGVRAGGVGGSGGVRGGERRVWCGWGGGGGGEEGLVDFAAVGALGGV